ncbi:DUF4402 domain-containing protein [Pseudomonadota bacterium]
MISYLFSLGRNFSLIILFLPLFSSEAIAAQGGIPGPPPPNANQCKAGWSLVAGATNLDFGAFSLESGVSTLTMNNANLVTATGVINLFTSIPTTTFTATVTNTNTACGNDAFTINVTAPALTGSGTMPLNLLMTVKDSLGTTLVANATPPQIISTTNLPLSIIIHGNTTATYPQASGAYSSAIAVDFTDSLATVLTTGGTATATSIQPIVLTQAAAMNFGAFAPDAAGDTVSLTNVAATVRSITTGTLQGGTVSSGQFTMTGTLGMTVGITVTDGTTDLVNGATTLVFTPTAASLSPTHVITGVAATDTLYVGGTITIPAAAATGTYTSTNAYTVTVNYQ